MYKDSHPGPQYSGRCSLASVALSPKSDPGNCLWGGVSSDLTTHLFSGNCVLKRVPSLTAELPPQEPTFRERLQGARTFALPPRLSNQTEILLPGLSHLSSTALLFPQAGAGHLPLRFLVPGQLLLLRETAIWTGCKLLKEHSCHLQVCRSHGIVWGGVRTVLKACLKPRGKSPSFEES